ncbi:MAG: hypothetical protein LBC41_11750 [Clostridiales bacterium]|jgi:hypothetical protein|nr:hypothetical protein [Clostridiales bacterium]
MKITTDFVNNSISSIFIMEKSLFKTSPSSPHEIEILAELQKSWINNDSLSPEKAENKVTLYDPLYSYYRENGIPPSALDLCEKGELQRLRAFAEKDGGTLTLLEGGHSAHGKMSEVQFNQVLPLLKDIVFSPSLAESISALFCNTELGQWLGRGNGIKLPIIERKRLHNQCSYLSPTMQYVLTAILLIGTHGGKPPANVKLDPAILSNIRRFNEALANEETFPVALLAKGKTASEGSFPEYPTDAWLARFSETGALLGVYSALVETLDVVMLQPVEKAFPPQTFALEFWDFWAGSSDKNVLEDFGYAILRFHQMVEERGLKEKPDVLSNIKKTISKDVSPADKLYSENFEGANLNYDSESAKADTRPLDELTEEEKMELGLGDSRLALSTRACDCLARANIRTIGDVVSKNIDDLKDIQNLGQTAVNEVAAKVRDLGFMIEGSDSIW